MILSNLEKFLTTRRQLRQLSFL